jgi:hypothetical protein
MTTLVIDAQVAIDLAAGGDHSTGAQPGGSHTAALSGARPRVRIGASSMDSERPKHEAWPNNSAQLLSVNVFRDRRICTRPIRSSV